jgi:hypothetical protein
LAPASVTGREAGRVTFTTPRVVVIAALAALTGASGAAVALPVQSSEPAAAVGPPTPLPVEVRTKTIHRTVRVIRHEKPRRARTTAAAPPRAVPVAAPPPRVPAAPVAAAVPPRRVVAPTRPLRSRTSGARGGDEGEHEREHESEGRDD